MRGKKWWMTSPPTMLCCVSAQRSQWKLREAQDNLLQWMDLQKQREIWWASTWQLYQIESKLTVISAPTGDRRLTGSCDFHTVKWHLTQTPNRLTISFFSHTRQHSFLINCAQNYNHSFLRGCKADSLPIFFTSSSIVCRNWFSPLHHITQKRKISPASNPLSSPDEHFIFLSTGTAD